MDIHLFSFVVFLCHQLPCYYGRPSSEYASSRSYLKTTWTRKQRNLYGQSSFKAAVYEHAVFLPLLPFYSRQGALNAMWVNLDIYEKQVVTAASEGADIIVFPEDGIYGMVFNRKKIEPFLEYIPDPRSKEWNPCEEPERYPNTDVQHKLSCLAKENSIYIVANMGDKQPCNHTDPHCPADGRYQYNTNVVFSSTGDLTARYHKQNLFNEDQFDTPLVPEVVYFDTPFGRFGTFTCFDILFRTPAVDLIEKHKIDTIVFPTAWRDVLPLLSAIEYHSAFAVQMGVNLLAANIHLPIARFGGSGVYSPMGEALFYRNANTFNGKLLIAHLTSSTNGLFVKNNSSNYVPRRGNSISKSSFIQSRISPTANCSFNSQCDTFQSVVFHDLYNFVWLKSLTGSVKVCKGLVCCYLDYTMTANQNSSDSCFALGVFDGRHTNDYNYYLQVCTLLKCADFRSSSCGEPVLTSNTYFSAISLKGKFKTRYVAPEILVVDVNGREALSQSGWSYDKEQTSLEAFGLLDPVLAVNLFGRWYDKD